jgi:uncharacterized protein YbaP (TraB family)
MKPMTIKYLALLFILLFTQPGHASASTESNQKDFLWKVKSERATVYLMGSIHLLKKEVYPLDRRIEEAFAASDFVVVEADINSTSNLDVQKLVDRAFYPVQESLEKKVSRETYEIAKEEFARHGITPQLMNRQRPWFLALTLTSLTLMQMGFDPEYGIERHFLSKAGRKKILELESLEYQIDLLSGFSDREQESFLLYTIKDLKLLAREAEALVHAWKSGDAEGIESILSKDTAEDGSLSIIYDKLMYERNTSMAGRIEEYLRNEGTYFVIVGAGHLVGKRGIIGIMKRKGYLPEQL